MVKKEDANVFTEDEVAKAPAEVNPAFKDTEHVQYNLTIDPNDPRTRVPAQPGVSLDELDKEK